VCVIVHVASEVGGAEQSKQAVNVQVHAMPNSAIFE